MTPIVVSIAVFACTFGAALAGMGLRAILPDHHLNAESRNTVTVGIGLIATLSALVLGLVTASAKSSFDTQDTTVKHVAADALSLDRVLAEYGPATGPVREALKLAIAHGLQRIWVSSDPQLPGRGTSTGTSEVEQVAALIRHLKPQTDEQRWLQSRALERGEALLEARWLIFASLGTAVPVPFLAILVFWLALTFVSFGLFSPNNATVVACLFLCALSVAGAVFLGLELDGPFDGLIKVSPNPLKYALARLNQ